MALLECVQRIRPPLGDRARRGGVRDAVGLVARGETHATPNPNPNPNPNPSTNPNPNPNPSPNPSPNPNLTLTLTLALTLALALTLTLTKERHELERVVKDLQVPRDVAEI